jgi:hypothetical protein
MQVTRNEFYDVSEPVLTDRSNDIDLDLVLNILSVPPVGDLTGTHVRITKCRLSHDSLILLGLVGRLNVLFAYDVQLGSCIVDVLESNRAGIHINVEALSARGKVSSNAMTHGKVVPLRRDWCGKSPAEGVNYGWESTGRLRGLLEVLVHEGTRITCQERELLVLGHGVITSSKELRRDLCVVVGLAVAASW